MSILFYFNLVISCMNPEILANAVVKIKSVIIRGTSLFLFKLVNVFKPIPIKM